MIILAWIIQILITIILSATTLIIFLSKDQNSTAIILLITIIAAGIYLCKIPLITAIYYSAKKIWRFIFILVLLIICVSEFEYLITLIEMVNQERQQLEGRNTFLFGRAIVMAFFVVVIPPIIALVGNIIKNKDK